MTRTWRGMVANGMLAVATLAAAALRFFPPTRYALYPRCPVYSSLHLLCPGCGTTRALAALLRGQIQEALHWNPLAVACMPFALVFLAKCYVRAVGAEEFVWPDIPEPWLKVSLVVIAVCTIVRNLHPF